MCPRCLSDKKLIKRGFYTRPSDGRRFQRLKCPGCGRSCSEQVFGFEYRLRKRENLQRIYRLLCRGMSQRAVAEEFSLHRDAIARRIRRFGRCCEENLSAYRKERTRVLKLQVDELISFEHTKCKPLTVPIAVEKETRRILSLRVGRIPASGHLAEISRRKYGFRRSERQKVLGEVFKELEACVDKRALIESDEAKEYPLFVRRHFPAATHKAYKGRRAITSGLGELKKGGFDPLFSLNHSYAMFRDNLKRLSRRTWATTKDPRMLEHMLYMYAWFHNLRLDRKKEKSRKPVRLISISALSN